MSLAEKIFLGCLGALAPILTNLLVVDYATTFSNITIISVISYLCRVLVLCASACLVVYLNADDNNLTKRITFFQLGVAAPAMLTAVINGTAGNINSKGISSYLPSVVSSAFAQEPAKGTSPNERIENCNLEPRPSVGQQILQGLAGILPDNRWFVVVSSNSKVENALNDAKEISAKYGNQFQVTVCQPAGAADSNYRVVIGKYLSYNDATRLKNRAINAGFSRDTWLWSPAGSSG